jgi:enterochelin esterase-like enzyme
MGTINMNNKLAFCSMFLLIPSLLPAQSGVVYDNLSLSSKILKMDRKYSIYLPPDYDVSKRSYPVLYLLHGSGDDQTGWVQFGEVNRIADKAINDGTATAMIIVMPDANTGRRGYFNSITGDFLYEDFFFQELIPFIEKTYRVRSEKRYRAVAGLSMGGGGTIVYAMHHPEMFAAACPLSAGNGLQEWATFRDMYKKTNPDLSESVVADYYKKHNGIELADRIADDQIKAVRWYIDCGDDDPRSESNSKFHVALNKKGVPHEFRIRDGAHTWSYWRSALPEVLGFITQSFHQF